LQVLLLISTGALADHGARRKLFLLIPVLVGTVAYGLMPAAVRPSLVVLAGVLVVIGKACFGTSYAFYQACIPTLVRLHPDVLAAKTRETDPAKIMQVIERTGSSISGHGIAIGYVACAALLGIGMAMIHMLQDVVYALQISCSLAAFCWLIAILTANRLMPVRPGPPLPAGEHRLLYSWKQLFRALYRLRKYAHIFNCLISWFIFACSARSVNYSLVLFKKPTSDEEFRQLFLVLLTVPLAAVIGTYFWLLVKRITGLTTGKILMLIYVCHTVLPIYKLIDLAISAGMPRSSWLWVMLPYHGFMFGAIRSFSRVMFSDMLPIGMECEFFGLYEVVNEFAAWIGPMIAFVLYGYSEVVRYAIIILIIILLLPVLLTWRAEVNRARREAQ
ncbi:autophagy-related protein 22-like protein, partial [Thamnocephalis sphaerospora]